jgi:hypothetical protein
VLNGWTDTDWFRFDGSDSLLCSVNPYASSDAVSKGARLCAFAVCTSGTTELQSCNGAYLVIASGLSGCCTTSQNHVEPKINCGSADNATIYIRVDYLAGNACVPYTIDYHY